MSLRKTAKAICIYRERKAEMKDEIIAAIMLFMMIGFFVFTTHTLTKGTEKVIKYIDSTEKHTELTADDIKNIKKLWSEEKKPLLYVLQ